MPKTYPREWVGLDFADHAPFRFVSTVDLPITPEALFAVLADAQSWPQWASVLTKVEWTSPEPRGVGTTRTVSMRGNIVGDEEFLAWEPFSHMAFRFKQKHVERHLGVRGGLPCGPHRRRVSSDLGDGDEAQGVAGRVGMMIGAPIMGWMFQRFLYNLHRYVSER